MKNAALLACGLAVVLVSISLVLASPFEWAPEDEAANYGLDWRTQFPYQRNIDWDFTVDPRGLPSPNGAPGAHYEGYDDDELMESDFVELGGEVQWFSEVDLSSFNPALGIYSGVIGILNPTSVPLSGTMMFHVDNHSGNDLKNLWFEWDFIASSADPALIEIDMSVLPEPPAMVVDDETIDASLRPIVGADPPLFRQNAWSHIEPNPAWEEILVELTVAPYNFILLDRLHVATECLSAVPEPSTLALLGLVFIAFLARRGRRS